MPIKRSTRNSNNTSINTDHSTNNSTSNSAANNTTVENEDKGKNNKNKPYYSWW